MSLCVAMNNPKNFVYIASDGRIRNIGNRLISDNHNKITKITDHVLLFASGVQGAADYVAKKVKKEVNEQTPISEIFTLVQNESRKCHEDYLKRYPELNRFCNSGHTTIAAILAYYDLKQNICGYVEYSHVNGFIPMVHNDSELKTRGMGQDFALELILKNFSNIQPVDNIVNAYRQVSQKEDAVGGKITIYCIDRNGAKLVYEDAMQDLTFGRNVKMGPDARLSWGQVTDQPFIPQTAADVGALTSQQLYTTLGLDYVVTGKIFASQINGGIANLTDSVTIGTPNSDGDKSIYFENMGNPVATIYKNRNGELSIWCDNKIRLSGYDGTQIVGAVGFFDKEPIPKQTASKLPNTITYNRFRKFE
ncbi:20S proteasome subunit alpha [Ruminiclostridium cellulolyticum]|uniref:20S proteasome A and B subunits n=1 Tax=Ruminiclostridium cellulolyticum (strain ATCC 35319 / DSM 5812 / JCM 6584 / H10) TaxID=394503 RepID=B8I342_RUMCH|nr:20S proteasome subunit alpha [Ruminiclostridium cellulolyticum]ACL76185.1 20S proteasome A and B subunits [Ruminiclostridium cellulolyticum H10]